MKRHKNEGKTGNVSWEVKLYSVTEVYRRFGGMYSFHLQVLKANQESSNTITRHHIPEHSNVNCYRLQNHQCHQFMIIKEKRFKTILRVQFLKLRYNTCLFIKIWEMSMVPPPNPHERLFCCVGRPHHQWFNNASVNDGKTSENITAKSSSWVTGSWRYIFLIKSASWA
jgi:hypothetical protein